MNFKEWLLVSGVGRSTISHYSGAIYGILSEFSMRLGPRIPLYAFTSLEEYNEQIKRLRSYPPFREQNAKGHRMYSAALGKFSTFLELSLSGSMLLSEINSIENDRSLSETQRKQVISARVGQGHYRRTLIELWQGKCSVTGYSDTRLLIASHIKPWAVSSNSERLDPHNGLLLTPNLDKAFDSGLISFDPREDGRILLSPLLKDPNLLGISAKLRLRELSEPTALYLKEHIADVFIQDRY